MPEQKHPAGFNVQSAFIGPGAVIILLLPGSLDRRGVDSAPLPAGSADRTVTYGAMRRPD